VDVVWWSRTTSDLSVRSAGVGRMRDLTERVVSLARRAKHVGERSVGEYQRRIAALRVAV